jgi:hypothetical protein
MFRFLVLIAIAVLGMVKSASADGLSARSISKLIATRSAALAVSTCASLLKRARDFGSPIATLINSRSIDVQCSSVRAAMAFSTAVPAWHRKVGFRLRKSECHGSPSG